MCLFPVLKIGTVSLPALCMAGINLFMFMYAQIVTVTSTEQKTVTKLYWEKNRNKTV